MRPFLLLPLLLLACSEDDDDDTAGGGDGGAAEGCATLEGTPHAGTYTSCWNLSSDDDVAFAFLGDPACPDCGFNASSPLPVLEGDVSCADGAFVEIIDPDLGGTGFAYAGDLTGDGVAGSCTVQTSTWTLDAATGAVSWHAIIQAEVAVADSSNYVPTGETVAVTMDIHADDVLPQ